MFNLLKFETKENHILALHTYRLNCLQYLKGLKLRFSEKATKFENLSEICGVFRKPELLLKVTQVDRLVLVLR